MEYRQYLEKIKNKIKNLTFLQKIFVCLLVLAFLSAVIYLYNPPKRLLELRNSTRREDVADILNAVYQYSASHEGNLPFSLTSQPAMICRSNAVSCEGLIDLSAVIAEEEKILSKVPVDPLEKDSNASGYQISKSPNGRISVSALLAENKAVISLSK